MKRMVRTNFISLMDSGITELNSFLYINYKILSDLPVYWNHCQYAYILTHSQSLYCQKRKYTCFLEMPYVERKLSWQILQNMYGMP